MQMGQFVDHDITHTPNHGVGCCASGGQMPRSGSVDEEKCFPIPVSSRDPFWKGRKRCMSFARSLASPGLTCGLQFRQQVLYLLLLLLLLLSLLLHVLLLLTLAFLVQYSYIVVALTS